MSSSLKISTQNGVQTITLSRPDVRNAFNDEVIAELKNAFLAVAQDAAVRCVVLAAEGPAFCAGADLNWMRRMADYTRDENLADAGELAAMLRAIYECPQPTIARLQGDVYAGGVRHGRQRGHGELLPERSQAGLDPRDDQSVCDTRHGHAGGAPLLFDGRALWRGRGAPHRFCARGGHS
jgi:methylglutaconyl-CoA hydratase